MQQLADTIAADRATFAIVALYAAAIFAVCRWVLPRVGRRMAVRSYNDPSTPEKLRFGGLEAHKLLAYPGEELSPASVTAALSSVKNVRTPDGEGVYLEHHISPAGARPAIAGRQVSRIVGAAESCYSNRASALEMSYQDAMAIPPAEDKQLADSVDTSKLVPFVRCYKPKVGMEGFGSMRLEDFERGREDPLTAPLAGLEQSLRTRSGERAMIQLCLFPASRKSVNALIGAERTHMKEPEKTSTVKRALGVLVLGLFKFAALTRLFTPSSGGQKDPAETKESQKVKSRRQSKAFYSVRFIASGYVEKGREPVLEQALDKYFERFSTGGDGALSFVPQRSAPAIEEVMLRRAAADPRMAPSRRKAEQVFTEEEIAAMWHPYGKDLAISSRETHSLVTIPPPVNLPTRGVKLAVTNHPGDEVDLLMDPAALSTHGRIVGTTGTGKSSLICRLVESIMRSEGQNGEPMGLMALDPTNTFFNASMLLVPPERRQDVLILDPTKHDHPVPGFNILEPDPDAPDAVAKVTDMVISALRRTVPSGWGNRQEKHLRMALMALAGANEKLARRSRPLYKITDLTKARFLAPSLDEEEPPPYRAAVYGLLAGDPDYEEVLAHWEQFDALKPAQQDEQLGPVDNKIQKLCVRGIKDVIASDTRDLDFLQIMEEGRLLLVNASQSEFSKETSQMFGTLLMNVLLGAALKRFNVADAKGLEGSLREFVVVVDEVQDFLCEDMGKVYVQGRKYRCPLWVAHQNLSQVADEDRNLHNNIDNAATKIYMRVVEADAPLVAKYLGEPFTAQTMAGMPNYNFVFRQEDKRVTCQTVPQPDRDLSLEGDFRDMSARNFTPGKLAAASAAADKASGGNTGASAAPRGGDSSPDTHPATATPQAPDPLEEEEDLLGDAGEVADSSASELDDLFGFGSLPEDPDADEDDSGEDDGGGGDGTEGR